MVTGHPRRELLAQHVQQRPAAAEHVAEADRTQPGVRPPVPLEDQLGDPFRGAQDGCRVGRLVGRDQHEALHVVDDGGLDQVVGAPDVGLHALAGVPLERGEVLEGRRVEHHLRPVLAKDLVDPLRVADVGDDHLVGVHRGRSPQLQLQAVQVRLIVVEHHQLLGSEPPDLATQLAADGPAGTRDQHALVGEHRSGGGLDDVHLGPADERPDLERAHVRADDLALEGGQERREVPERDAVGGGPQAERTHPVAGEGRDRDDHHVHGARGQHPVQVCERPETRWVRLVRQHLARRVVEETHRRQPERADPLQVPAQRPPCLAGPHDQGAQTGRLEVAALQRAHRATAPLRAARRGREARIRVTPAGAPSASASASATRWVWESRRRG